MKRLQTIPLNGNNSIHTAAELDGAGDQPAPSVTIAEQPDSPVMRELRELKSMVQTLLRDKGVTQPDYLDAKTLAKRLGISVTTLYRQVAAGELPDPEKFGSSSRWKWADVEDAIARRK